MVGRHGRVGCRAWAPRAKASKRRGGSHLLRSDAPVPSPLKDGPQRCSGERASRGPETPPRGNKQGPFPHAQRSLPGSGARWGATSLFEEGGGEQNMVALKCLVNNGFTKPLRPPPPPQPTHPPHPHNTPQSLWVISISSSTFFRFFSFSLTFLIFFCTRSPFSRGVGQPGGNLSPLFPSLLAPPPLCV